jgi:hypothetical protein
LAVPADQVPGSQSASRTNIAQFLSPTQSVGQSIPLAIKSELARLDVTMAFLRRRFHESERQYHLASESERPMIGQTLETVFSKIQATEKRIREISQEYAYLREVEVGGVETAEKHNDLLAGELDQVRLEVLTRLAELAEPLRQFQRLAEKKTHLARELGSRSGRDLSYANYVDSALVRKREYAGDLAYTLEFLRTVRVVS